MCVGFNGCVYGAKGNQKQQEEKCAKFGQNFGRQLG